jgi:hypothetical protein
MKNRNRIFLCLLISFALAHIGHAIGPTPPDVKAAKMKAKNISAPTDQQIKLIEAAAPVKPVKPRKVLVWGHTWTHPPNPYAEKALEILARKAGAFEAVISDDPGLLLGDNLRQFDALVMNNIHEREPFLPDDFARLKGDQRTEARELDKAIKQSILQYVRSGKGRVFYTTLGHDAATYWNPVFLKHLLAGVQFAIGDLEGETTPLAAKP